MMASRRWKLALQKLHLPFAHETTPSFGGKTSRANELELLVLGEAGDLAVNRNSLHWKGHLLIPAW